MKVITTIQLDEGDFLTDEKLAKIQAIVKGNEPPVEGTPDCEEGPEPNKVTVIDELTLDVQFHAKEVTPMGWKVSDLAGNSNGSGQLEPKSNVIRLKLSSPITSAEHYRVTLTGVDCTGEFSLEFKNPYYIPPVTGNPCKTAPKPLVLTMFNEHNANLTWHGEEVEELEVLITTKAGKKAGGLRLKPMPIDRGNIRVPMTNTFDTEEDLIVTIKGISCDGGNSLVFPNPFKKKDDADECCEAGMSVKSIQLTENE